MNLHPASRTGTRKYRLDTGGRTNGTIAWLNSLTDCPGENDAAPREKDSTVVFSKRPDGQISAAACAALAESLGGGGGPLGRPSSLLSVDDTGWSVVAPSAENAPPANARAVGLQACHQLLRHVQQELVARRLQAVIYAEAVGDPGRATMSGPRTARQPQGSHVSVQYLLGASGEHTLSIRPRVCGMATDAAAEVADSSLSILALGYFLRRGQPPEEDSPPISTEAPPPVLEHVVGAARHRALRAAVCASCIPTFYALGRC